MEIDEQFIMKMIEFIESYVKSENLFLSRP